MPEKTKLSKRISDILGYVSIIIVILALLSYSYKAGQKSHRMDNMEERQNKSEQVDTDINTRLDEQFYIINAADIKLGLLLDYFHITDSTRYN